MGDYPETPSCHPWAGAYGWATWEGDGAPTNLDLSEGEFVRGMDLLPEGIALLDVLTWPGQQRSARLHSPSGATLGILESCERPRLICRDGGRMEAWCAAPLTRTTWVPGDDRWELVDSTPYPDLDVQSLRVLEPGD